MEKQIDERTARAPPVIGRGHEKSGLGDSQQHMDLLATSAKGLVGLTRLLAVNQTDRVT